MKGAPPLAIALALSTWACGNDDPTGVVTPCADDVGRVSVTVGAGLQPVIDWEPDCAVAFVLIEEGASDVWSVGTDPPGTTDIGDPDLVNLILPPVTFGVVPDGVDEFQAPEPLQAGHTYEVVLWRSPPGSTADCMSIAFGGCLMAVHEFFR
ncbi:MAG: hypothetical protein HKO77_08200 [Gemmatimonadetes bacterium]|nr:hypothetical protein [Gemmatimonadota bacterium]